MAQHNIERREYIRLNSCFPVEFSLCFLTGVAISHQYQGFTCDVSAGGLCLQAKNLNPADLELVLNKKSRFDLLINIPMRGKPVKAFAEIAWVKKSKQHKDISFYHIGLSYVDIEPEGRKRIVSYARRLKWVPRIGLALIVLMMIGLITLSSYHLKVSNQNKVLVTQLVSSSEVKADIAKRLNEIKIRKDMLERSLLKGAEIKKALEAEIDVIEEKALQERESLEQELKEVLLQQKGLQAAIAKLSAEGITSDEMAYKVTESRLIKLNTEVELLQVEISEVMRKAGLEKQELENKIKNLQMENTALKDQIIVDSEGEILLEEQLARMKYASGEIEKASIDKMLDWIKTHQIRRTGLVLSYEGDLSLKDWGFIYDQALASQVFLISGETERAKNILDFFNERADRSEGLFYNAYDVRTGTPREYIIHSGPNIWIAITACQYVYQTQDLSFLEIAEGIAHNMIRLQKKSADGSIKGGPGVEWVSTEHNLDAYALFMMLHNLTQAEKYAEAASVTLDWLRTAGYNREEGRFMRGKGDATIATDTFSWAIAALGPDILVSNGMDPDGIMEFAEAECRVEVKFYRPEGRSVDIVGFDFAKASHVGRGGIVSTEWTAQMVVAFQIMAEYYKREGSSEKERIYNFKAQYYLAQLGKMVISSPSPTGQGQGCLPYASIDNVDTGHGWRVAHGRRTGSVAGTAYYIFAYKGYNPLGFKD
jgi:hypothetical protein